MRNQFPFWIITIAVIASLQGIVRAQPEEHELNMPFAALMTNPCNGEEVLIEGTIDTLVQTTFDESGGSHNKFHVASKGKGTAMVTGTRYVYSEEENQELSESDPFPVTFSWEINHLLTSAGSEDDFFAKLTLHITLNANGALTASVANVQLDCRG